MRSDDALGADRRRERRRVVFAWGFLTAGLVATAVQVALAPEKPAGVVQVVILGASLLVMLVATLRHGRQRDAVEWLAILTVVAWLVQGLGFWLPEILDTTDDAIGTTGYVVVSSLAYVPLFTGLALFCRRHIGDQRAYMLLLDATLFGAAISFALWTLWLDPTPKLDEPLLERETILAIQPLMDIVLVVMLVGFLVITRTYWAAGLWALIVGGVALTGADLDLVHGILDDAYVPGSAWDAGWSVFVLSLAFAFAHPSLQRLRVRLADIRPSPRYERQLVVLGFTAAAWIGIALAAATYEQLDVFALVVTGAVGIAAILVKLGLLVLALDAATVRQSGVLDGVPTAILLVDASGRVTAVNESAGLLTGLDVGDPLSEPLEALVERTVGDDRAEDIELVLVTPGGAERVVVGSLGRTLETGERVLALSDVTEQRRVQRQVGHAQRLELVGRLAGGVAHDFNNSLMAIRATAEEALDRPGEAAGALGEIVRTADMSRDVVEQLLAFSRGTPLDLVVLDATAAMEEVFGLGSGLIGRSIAARFVAGGPAPVRADRGTLQQAVLNLIVNARDAMPGGGELELEVRTLGETTVEIAVADTGVGMTEDVRRQAVLPFFSTKSDEGTGLGLAMVHGTVESLGGELVIESAPDAGTTVRIRLPLVAPSAEDVEAGSGGEVGATPAERLAGRHILLVDDDERILDLVAKMLGRLGAEVRSTTDPREVARLVQEGPLDVVVTDLTMPDVDGAEVTRLVRAAHPQAGVVLMSGFNPSEVALLASLGPRGAFLRKPFARAQLVDALDAALAGTTDDA